MKNRRIWSILPLIILLLTLVIVLLSAVFFYSTTLFYVCLGATVFVFGIIIWQMFFVNSTIHNILKNMSFSLDASERLTISSFPLPVVVFSDNSEILWYNDLFLKNVLNGKNIYGASINLLTDGLKVSEMAEYSSFDVSYDGAYYTAYYNTTHTQNISYHALYFTDDTELKETAAEYTLSRPAVILFFIDSLDELLQNARESERAHISGQVEVFLEDFTTKYSGIFRKYTTERFLVVVEQRDLKEIFENKFEVLNNVKEIKTSDGQSITISAGVGQGSTFRESEKIARQSIDMALGRGGDQAAVKTDSGFEFFGGISTGREKRTKVRTRVVASALLELIHNSDIVYVTGHRNSDLDSLGSGVALASAIRSLDKTAYFVVDTETSMATELIKMYKDADRGNLFLDPANVTLSKTRNILSIITDTHNPHIVEHPPLITGSTNLVVIDHHRKMVDFIDNAVIFYHEPNASSASEMVTELIQYLGDSKISRLDAEALLAGIALDTRNFVIRAGVRTFEAAAYLRRLGADTIKARRMSTGNMDMYKQKMHIVGNAEMYGKAAISICDDCDNSTREFRIAAAQAADELLYIRGVDASFVLFKSEKNVNVSARSLGDYNVQLVMEQLGGGGHLSMAGAQIEGVETKEANEMLISAINTYLYNINQEIPKVDFFQLGK